MVNKYDRFYENKNLPRNLIGSSAVLLSLFFLFFSWPQTTVVIISIYFIIACTTDTLSSKIPNTLNAGLTIFGLAMFFCQFGWLGYLVGFTGLVIGFCLLLLPWLMGGMGAGDVKALGAIGALLGPEPVFQVFLYTGLYGGLLAILHYLFARNIKDKTSEWLDSFKATVLTKDPAMIIPTTTEPLRFPYAAAIAFGYYTYLIYGGVL
jgi:prepilin peptidase CpaA